MTAGKTSDATAVKSVSLQEARQLRDAPPPYPFSWYAVALCAELRAGAVLTRRFVDREIVIYRTESGTVCAVEAYCPHLGAHLGHGGKVCGEELRCPFHGFRFSVNGSCVYSPSGAPPPAARLGLLEVREIYGAIFVWHGPAGQVPWEIEGFDDESEWRQLKYSVRHVHNHPQELAENSIDITHFSQLHGFGKLQVTQPEPFDGPRLSADYTFKQLTPWKSEVEITERIRLNGLGCAITEADVQGFSLRLVGMATPIGERDCIQRLLVLVRKRGESILSKAFWRCAQDVLLLFVMRKMMYQINQDHLIWNHKKYLHRPAIGEGDGPIHAYRRWVSQFYPEGAAW